MHFKQENNNLDPEFLKMRTQLHLEQDEETQRFQAVLRAFESGQMKNRNSVADFLNNIFGGESIGPNKK